jgi:hypothetical protein
MNDCSIGLKLRLAATCVCLMRFAFTLPHAEGRS